MSLVQFVPVDDLGVLTMSMTNYYLLLILLIHGSKIKTCNATTATKTTGFSLKLIHIDDPRSPLYNANLTNQQRYQRLHELSQYRAKWMESLATGIVVPLQIAPGVQLIKLYNVHTVLVSIGTPPKQYHLILDVGSGVVWTQCQPCENCYEQTDPIFDPSHSTTSHQIPCTDPLCRPPVFTCLSGVCTYNITYDDGSVTNGVLMREKLTATSSGRQTHAIANFVFGCSRSSPVLFHGQISGILGMNFAATSLASQVSNRFSYCLSKRRKKTTFLRFGDDVRGPTRISSTSLVRYLGVNAYFLTLVDVGILGSRLNLPSRIFERRSDGTGGTVIDTGTSFSTLIRPAYDRVREVIVEYFNKRSYKVVSDERLLWLLQMDLCYFKKRGLFRKLDFEDFPSLDLHFPQSVLSITGKHLFIYSSAYGVFCLAIYPTDGVSLIGNYQQRDFRFVYDLHRRLLEFGPHDCSND